MASPEYREHGFSLPGIANQKEFWDLPLQAMRESDQDNDESNIPTARNHPKVVACTALATKKNAIHSHHPHAFCEKQLDA